MNKNEAKIRLCDISNTFDTSYIKNITIGSEIIPYREKAKNFKFLF